MKRQKLLDVYNNPYVNGIVYNLYIYSNNNSSLAEFFSKLGITEADSHSMDVDYYYNRSGFKSISVMLEFMVSNLITEDMGEFVVDSNGKLVSWSEILSQLNRNIINDIIVNKFLTRWNKLTDTLLIEYNPLKPYDMSVETESNRKMGSVSDNTRTNKDTMSSSYSSHNNSSSSGNGSSNNNDSVYGFNSVDAVPSDKSNGSNNYENSNKIEGSGSDNGTRNTNGSSNTKYDTTENRNGTIKRSGNIGNQSAMELIDKQRSTALYQIWEVIYNDLDSILTRSKYC